MAVTYFLKRASVAYKHDYPITNDYTMRTNELRSVSKSDPSPTQDHRENERLSRC